MIIVIKSGGGGNICENKISVSFSKSPNCSRTRIKLHIINKLGHILKTVPSDNSFGGKGLG